MSESKLGNKLWDICRSFHGVDLNLEKISKIFLDNSKELLEISVDLHNNQGDVNAEEKLDLEDDHEILWTKAKDEKNAPYKIIRCISYLHSIVYHTLTTSSHVLFELDGQKEMASMKRDSHYWVYLCKDADESNWFIMLCLMFALESNYVKNLTLGMDFEFTRDDIKLAQVAFEHRQDHRSITMMVGPPQLTADQTVLFIKTVMINHQIRKIVHGADSKDIPYLFKGLLKDNFEWVLGFSNNLVDTRFVCEYYRAMYEPTNNKCAIYDIDPEGSAVYQFGVIDAVKQEELKNLMLSMPHHHDIRWDVRNIPQSQILYAQYDVLFLKQFFYRIIRKAADKTPNQVENQIKIYRSLIPAISQLTFLESNGYTELRKKCKEDSDEVNNYYFIHNGRQWKAIDIFRKTYEKVEIRQPVKILVSSLEKVNNFKALIRGVCQRIVYGYLSQYNILRKNKLEKWRGKLDNEFLAKFFRDLGMDLLGEFFQNILKELGILVKAMVPN